MIMRKNLQGILALLGATLIWGFAFTAQSVGMDHIGPFTFQAIRCALAVVFLLLMTVLVEVPKSSFPEWRNRWTNPRLWKAGMICGTVLFIAANLQQLGLVYTDAGKAGFLTAMYIVIVPILGVFLGKKPPVNAVVSVFLAVVGLYLLSCVGVSEINIGDVLLVGCALGFSVQILLIDHFAVGLDGMRLSCIQALMVTILSAPIALFSETITISGITACWLPLCFAGILSMGVAYSLQIVGQQKLEPTAASLIMSLESVFAVLGGWMILHETMNGWEISGCILVFSAVIISQLPLSKKKAIA